MALVDDLAAFVVRASWDDLSGAARHELAVRVLDSLGCAIGGLDGGPVRVIRAQVEAFGGAPSCSLIGGGRTSPDQAALHNGACVRYLDFNDSFLASGETCHPSDSIAPVLAAAQVAGASGWELMTAIAVAYQVQCRLSESAPVRARGFDHTTQGAYAVAAGVAKALALNEQRTANAIAIAGTALNALRVTRTGALSHWKGLAFPFAAFGATRAAFLAAGGITGPSEVFEGNKGFMEAIAGPFTIDWRTEDLEAVGRTILKRFNAEIHSQSALEAAIELREEHRIDPARIERVELEVFDVAYKIIGGGEEGDKTIVGAKEEADHSLPYLLAVALLDGEVLPGQYAPERIRADDVQALLRKVKIRPADDLSERFPAELGCRLSVHLDGKILDSEKHDYEGFHTRPMTWGTVVEKFERLAASHTDARLRERLVDAVEHIDEIAASDLCVLLEEIDGGGE